MQPPEKHFRFKKKIKPVPLIIQWILQKDNRGFILSAGAAYGIIIITVYYLWLGFTPSINLGETSLLLIKAVFAGILFFYCSALIFAPVWAYTILGTDVDAYREKPNQGGSSRLFWRSLLSQTIGIYGLLACFFWPFNEELNLTNRIYWAISVEALFFALLFLFSLPKPQQESFLDYYWSIFVIGLLGCISLILLILIYKIAPEGGFGEGSVFLASAFVLIMSSILGSLGKQYWVFRVLAPFGLSIYLLLSFNSFKHPIRAAGVVMGVAESRPVDIVVSKDTCPTMQIALQAIVAISCEGENAGLISKVNLENTLGSRWVLRFGNNIENIVFDGEGTVIVEQPNADNKKKKDDKKEQAEIGTIKE